MHVLALTIALFATGASQAQTDQPRFAASPDAVTFKGGWQLTMHHNACVLTHSAGGGRQDLVIVKQFDRPANFVMGLPLFAGQIYLNRVQLSVVAQADVADPVGRLTYMPVRGQNGTVLIAPWPAEQLLTVMNNAKQLGFYDPERHLVRLVNLVGIADASARLRSCVRDDGGVSMADAGIATVDPKPSNGFPSNIYDRDRGWVNETDHGNCHLSRRTARGNELSLTMIKGSPNLLFQLFVYDGHSAASGTVLAATFELNDLGDAVDGTWGSRSDTDRPKSDVMNIHMRASNGDHGLNFLAIIDGSYIQRLRKTSWNQLTVDMGSGWKDSVNILGADQAVVNFRRCLSTPNTAFRK